MPAYPPLSDSPIRTFGVEEELLLVDARSYEPVPVAQEAVHAAGAVAGPGSEGFDLTLEVQQEQIEIAGPPQISLAAQLDSIRTGRALADAAAALVGARAVAVATAPGILRPHLVPHQRYRRMQERFGLLLQEQLTCGFHVHVGISSAEEGIAALDRIRYWLPVLLALSGNSPFWNGRDSGYSSYRYQAWSRWPTAGPPPLFGSPAAYHRHVELLMASAVPLDKGMMYFDARLSRHVPTLEVRIADVCMDAGHAAGLAGLVRGLVETAIRAWRSGSDPLAVSAAELQIWSWQASRAGVGGQLISPSTGRPAPAGDVVAQLLDEVRPVLAEWGEDTELEAIVAGILRDGTGAVRQLAAYGRREDPADVLEDAVRATHVPDPAPLQPGAA